MLHMTSNIISNESMNARYASATVLFFCLLTGCGGSTEDERVIAAASSKRVPSVAPIDIQQSKKLAKVAEQAHRYDEAIALLKKVLLEDPSDSEALYSLAICQAGKGDFAVAIETLNGFTPEQPGVDIAMLGQSADWLIQLQRYDEAEKKLLQMIASYGDIPLAHRRLSQLFNSQGRRIDASIHMRKLASLGDISEHELYGLTTFSDPFLDEVDASLTTFSSVAPSELSRARMLWYDGRHREARELAEQLWIKHPDSTAISAFCGRVLADSQDEKAFEDWRAKCGSAAQREPEFWYAMGTWHQHQNRHAIAVRCFLEAVSKDDTDRFSYLGLARSLIVLNRPEKAAKVMLRYEQLDEIAFIASEINRTPSQLSRIVELLKTLRRPAEAKAWSMIAGIDNASVKVDDTTNIATSSDDASWRRCGLSLEAWPLPELDKISPSPLPVETIGATQPGKIVLTNVSATVALDFQYQPSPQPNSEELRMHETNGGGIAALDFDLDGWVDLYFSQGGGQPHDPRGSKPKSLFRNFAGTVFSDVTAFAGADDRGYGQGVAAADVNQDGFVDLLVANIGKNVLCINNGDGTFQRSWLAGDMDGADAWTTSIACGDLSGDHLPDIVEINYIDDRNAYTALCSGTTKVPLCNPQRYRPGRDRFLKNGLDGSWAILDDGGTERPLGYGYAAVIANFDRKSGNDLFITNDTSPNHYWKSQPKREQDGDSNGEWSLIEQAQLSGCAVGMTGVPQSCMGIASGDFDRNGQIDFHITNYTDESSDLFLQNSSGLFVNQFLQYGLDQATRSQLGWGTQAVDFDGDGWLDIAILNGNIYKDSKDGSPYRMVPQLFQGSHRHFTIVPSHSNSDSFWSTPTLGRTVATLDWNRDGRTDLIANHLDAPVALLQNESVGGNWIQLELVGTTSERDAVGTEVVIRCGDETWTQWVTGGDGFLCSCEPVLSIGIGSAKKIDALEIRWPSGLEETHTIDTINHRHLFIEGESGSYARSE